MFACAAALLGCHGEARSSLNPNLAHQAKWFYSGGERIAVDVTALPQRGRRPAILLLAPSDGTEGSGGAYLAQFADDFATHGYVAYIVHYFDRTGTIRSDDALEDRLYPEWTETLRDALVFIQHDSLANPRRIGVFGYSLGGYMALSLGATDPRPKALVVLSGGFFNSLAPTIKSMPPTLLLHGADDTTVPVREALRVQSTLARLRIPHELVVYPGQGHRLTPDRDADAAARAIRYFNGYLRPRWWRRVLQRGERQTAGLQPARTSLTGAVGCCALGRMSTRR
jgi:Dipeptidyl aminopeptidases/acylaminoacyl-peptidases